MASPLAGGSGTDFKSQILSSIDIVALIGQTVALKRRGRDFVGLCPFHSEKTPSFSVSPAKQVFYCQGCKVGGNSIDFVMRRDRIGFVEAMQLLGQQLGLEMPALGASKEKVSRRQELLEACSAAVSVFEKNLADEKIGAPARSYLESRGFTPVTIKAFQVGFAQDAWESLVASPIMKKFPPALLFEAGLVKQRETGRGGGFYDAFRNRVIFPIRDENGRVIAFGGRVMPGSTDAAKYLNSAETPLFSKSRCAYGLDLAKKKIVESNPRTVAVVEGYTDVVMAHQFGATNVVSVLGTAMTEQHISLLRRFADRIVLLFDADNAGDLAVNRAVELFLTQPVEIAIAGIPEDLDPDEYLLKHGLEAFDKLLGNAQDALTYKWRQMNRQYDATGDLTGRQRAVEQYLQTLANARGSGPVDALRWGSALARVSRLTEIPIDELNRRFKVSRSPRRAGPVTPAPATQGQGGPEPTKQDAVFREDPLRRTARDRTERGILGLLLAGPKRWHEAQRHIRIDDFTDENRRKLAEIFWMHLREEGEPSFPEFLSFLQEEQLKSLSIELVSETERIADPDVELKQLIGFLEHAAQRLERDRNTMKLKTEQLNEQEQIELLMKLQDRAKNPDLRKI